MEMIELAPIEINPTTFLYHHCALPALPRVVTEFQEVAHSENVSISRVVNILSSDPSLVAEILKVVNSAYYSLPREVSRVDMAVAYLGTREVQNIVLTVSVVDTFGIEEPAEFKKFWHHSLYTALCARFPYQPEDKILIEAYNDRGYFDVRVAGVPHIGLLGVSFGDVIALNTPKAQARRPYNWARTLWHELAHTMAIGVSKHHVPRWFTEGLSVYEEQRARPEWGREMDLEFFSAFDRDKLHRLEEIDRGFTRPEFPGQILLSYYHASKVIAFIVDQYGFEAITDILAGLGQGLDQEAVFRQVLGQSRNALDLREIHGPSEKSAGGEFARLRLPRSKFDHSFQ